MKDLNELKEIEVPRATAKRLAIYHRYLRFLHYAGKRRISSTELSEAVKVDSATIRRDFSYFGALGKRGYGYDVEYLLEFFSHTLNQDRLTNVALVGVGKLGQALLNYNFHQSNNVRIRAAFDVNEDIVGTIQTGVPVYSMDEMVEQLKVQQIQVAILTVPRCCSRNSRPLSRSKCSRNLELHTNPLRRTRRRSSSKRGLNKRTSNTYLFLR